MSEAHPPAGSVRPAPEGVALDGFEQLLAVGRQRGYLTQDDLILVLQAVELSHDIIEDVVERVRAEGIEYLEQTRVGAAPVALAEAVAVERELVEQMRGRRSGVVFVLGIGVEGGGGVVV